MNTPSPKQQFAIDTAARLIDAADLNFVLMLFDDGGQRMLVADIEPECAIRMLEALLSALREKGTLAGFPLDGEETLQ